MKLFGDDLKVEVDIWELFKNEFIHVGMSSRNFGIQRKFLQIKSEID